MATPVTVEQSRSIPVEVQHAFDVTLTAPLATIFSRRHVVLPPVKEVRDQEGAWGRVGQTRVVVTSDGGAMRETLTDVSPPRSFSYELNDITGPMRPLVEGIDGRWEFAPKGTGTVITWRWTLHPRALGAPLMPLVTRMWRRYAAKALEQLSDVLLTSGTS